MYVHHMKNNQRGLATGSELSHVVVRWIGN